MTEADRLAALRDLFLAGGNVSDGARKVIGFLLSIEGGSCRQAEIRDAFATSPSNAWRWIADAREAGLIPAKGPVLRVDDVDIGRLRELAGRGGEEPSP